MLTATILARTALMLLRIMRDEATHEPVWPKWAEAVQPQKGLYGLKLWLEDADLALSVDDFAVKRLQPAMEAWIQTVRHPVLDPRYLLLPMGVAGAANERLDGMAMRCVIVENEPIRERDVPGRMAHWYDVTQDVFEDCLCAPVVSFWVHTAEIDDRRLLSEADLPLA